MTCRVCGDSDTEEAEMAGSFLIVRDGMCARCLYERDPDFRSDADRRVLDQRRLMREADKGEIQ